MSGHEAHRWPTYRDRFLEATSSAFRRHLRQISCGGLIIDFGCGVDGEYLELTTPERGPRSLVLRLRPRNRAEVRVERGRKRRRATLLRLDELWLVNRPARIVEAFERSLVLVTGSETWGVVQGNVCELWEEVTLGAT